MHFVLNHMIHNDIVNTISRLLKEEQWSQREIARLTGVGRGTVGRIANGERSDTPEKRREKNKKNNDDDNATADSDRGITPGRYLGVNLPPEFHARYLEVRERRKKHRDELYGKRHNKYRDKHRDKHRDEYRDENRDENLAKYHVEYHIEYCFERYDEQSGEYYSEYCDEYYARY